MQEEQGNGIFLERQVRVGVLAFTALWIGKFDLQLYDLHLHPEAETSLAVRTCVSQVVVVVMFLANTFVAHLRQPLPILLFTMYSKESFQHTHLIHIRNGRL